MVQDPFYTKIVGGLSGHLDGEVFEHCVADLLREELKGIDSFSVAAIPGGHDAGMDGAVADGKGPPFPIICTTAKNVLGNLRTNLKRYVEEGGLRRRAVVATSQALTPRRIQNLYETAREEFGFELVQVYSRQDITNLLYRSPRWCHELLGLTYARPALSAIPDRRRPKLSRELVGRDDDLAWLRDTPGDLLLVGQPGSGKTFLLEQFVSEGHGLFAVVSGCDEIAGAFNEQRPAAIIVDDALDKRDLLADLRGWRERIKAQFRIIASCWQHEADRVKAVLQVEDVSIRQLGLLTQQEMLDVVRNAGIRGPNRLIREIIGQARGKPGLAVTLCATCLTGRFRPLVTGDKLLNYVRNAFEDLVAQEGLQILASFAIGGASGMALDDVAGELGQSPAKVQLVVHGLAAGGIIEEVAGRTLSVHPRALRHALVRDMFFSGSMSLSPDGLMDRALDYDSVTETLIGAKARGGSVDDTLIRQRLERSYSEDVWRAYAWLGPEQTSWVLDSHPEKLMVVVDAALTTVPEKAIPTLLTKAAEMPDKPPTHFDHPFRKLEEWVESALPTTGEAVSRRKDLLDLVVLWQKAGGDIGVALSAARWCMSPGFMASDLQPVNDATYGFRMGHLTLDEMKELRRLWPRVRDLLHGSQIRDWAPVREMASNWAYPGSHPGPLPPKEQREYMRSFACEMLGDVLKHESADIGLRHWAKQLSKDADLTVAVELDIDPEFEVLFPVDDRLDRKSKEKEQRDAALALAEQWADKTPQEIADRLAGYDERASNAGIHWPRLSLVVCVRLSELVRRPIPWASAMMDANVPAGIVWPFLFRAVREKGTGWRELWEQCLAHPTLRSAAINIALATEEMDEEVLDKASAALDESLAQSIRCQCRAGEVPERRVLRLLRHENPAIAAAAAIGEWEANPAKKVRESLLPDWQNAIVKCEYDYSLAEVFEAYPRLAFEWLRARIQSEQLDLLSHRHLFEVATQELTDEERVALIGCLPTSGTYGDVVSGILGESINVYRRVLASEHLKRYHLAVLRERWDSEWIKEALDANYPAEKVARAIRGDFDTWCGDKSAHWEGWAARFDTLHSSPDPRVRHVGELGKAWAEDARQRALQEEEKERIYGLDWDR